MNKYNDKGEKHGPWEKYHDNVNLMYKENWVNGKAHGIYERYYSNGNLWFKACYSNGKNDGVLVLYNFVVELNLKRYFI